MSRKVIRFVVLTGPPGCGKTTLVKKVCDDLKARNFTLNGFFTEEVRSRTGRRVGFDVVLLNGDRAPLARVNSGDLGEPMVGKYAVDLRSFETTVLPILDPKDENSIWVLDEIGKMELISEKFKETVCQCFNSKRNIILSTVPEKSRHISLVEAIKQHPNTSLITVTMENRSTLPEEVVKLILNAKQMQESPQKGLQSC